jgi:hypothetical protein
LRQRGEEEEARLVEKAMYDMEAPHRKAASPGTIAERRRHCRNSCRKGMKRGLQKAGNLEVMLFPQAKKEDKREEETGQPPREHVNWAQIFPLFFFQRCQYDNMCLCGVLLGLEVIDMLQVPRMLR